MTQWDFLLKMIFYINLNIENPAKDVAVVLFAMVAATVESV